MVRFDFIITGDKCTKRQFIHLLTATFKDLHIENSKNYKRWYCPQHTDRVYLYLLFLLILPNGMTEQSKRHSSGMTSPLACIADNTERNSFYIHEMAI